MNNTRRRTSIQLIKNIASLNPLERWNSSNVVLQNVNEVETMTGIYNGIDFELAGTPNPPLLINNNVVFDGIDDRLRIGTVNQSLFLNSSATFFGVLKYDPINSILVIGDTTAERVTIGSVADHFFVVAQQNGLHDNRFESTSTLTAGDFYILCVTTNGSQYEMYINNVQETLNFTDGVNDGAWSGNFSASRNVQLGTLVGNAFRSAEIKDYVYYDKYLNSAERSIVFNELNNLYNIY